MQLPPKEFFEYKECVISGDDCYLIYPKVSDSDIWTKENLGFRSIIVRKEDNFVVSRGFPKFFNLGQCPRLTDDIPYKSFNTIEKKDGSLLIVSRYKGETILRTRGTIDISSLENGSEKSILLEKYKDFFEILEYFDTFDFTFLFEWQTPSNVIVIDEVPEPTLTFLAYISNHDGEIFTTYPDNLPDCFNHTEKLNFNSVGDVVEYTKNLNDKEGYVLYFHDNMGKVVNMLKVKTPWYVDLHYNMTSIPRTPKRFMRMFLDYCDDRNDLSQILSKRKTFDSYIKAKYSYEFYVASENIFNLFISKLDNVIDKLKVIVECVDMIKSENVDKATIAKLIKNKFVENNYVAFDYSNHGNFSTRTLENVLEKELVS